MGSSLSADASTTWAGRRRPAEAVRLRNPPCPDRTCHEMTPSLRVDIAEAILWLHVVVIAFSVFGLVAIPLGAWGGWRGVRVFWWRALHVGILGIVALQAVLGRACFLTIWESNLLRLEGQMASNDGVDGPRTASKEPLQKPLAR